MTRLDGGIVLCHLDSLITGQIPAFDLLVARSHENLGAVLYKQIKKFLGIAIFTSTFLTSLQQMSKTGPCMDCIDFGMVLPLCSTSQHRTYVFEKKTKYLLLNKINFCLYVVVPAACNEESLRQSSRAEGHRGD